LDYSIVTTKIGRIELAEPSLQIWAYISSRKIGLVTGVMLPTLPVGLTCHGGSSELVGENEISLVTCAIFLSFFLLVGRIPNLITGLSGYPVRYQEKINHLEEYGVRNFLIQITLLSNVK